MTARAFSAVAAPLAAAVLSTFVAPAASLAAIKGYYRFPTIHGEQIVFTCEGDLWKVSTAGGVATRLTSHPAGEVLPQFSPDGQWIAFTADYQGNGDIYVIPASGGEPRRLTFHPTREQCIGWTPDSKSVVFSTRRSGLDSESTAYTVPVEGGHPTTLRVGVCESASFSADGKQIAFNPFTWGGTWKRYRGGTAPEVWAGDLSSGKFWKVTDNDAIDQNPMWIGDRIYMLSERAFPVNVWSCKPDGSDAKQITHHNDYDVRFADTDGKQIVYTVAAEIWVTDASGSNPRKVDVTIPTDRIRERPRVEDASKTVESFDLSSDGKRIAVSSRGEIWNAPAKPGGRVIHVTDGNSAIRERGAAYSPDDSKLVCITDEGGEQQLAVFDAAGKQPRKILTKDAKGWIFLPQWSNDSKRVAFADMTGTLYVADAESGETKKVDQDRNWELTEYTFSPDSKWIAYTKIDDNRVQSIYIAELATGNVTKVSGGFMNDYSPAWDPQGRYLYFLSNRVINPSLDELDRSFLVTRTAKPCAAILQKDGKSPFLPEEMLDDDQKSKGDSSKDDKDDAGGKDGNGADKEKADAAAQSKAGDAKASPATEPGKKDGKKKKEWKDVKIDVDGIALRVVEFPVKNDNCTSLAATDGKVFWVTSPTRTMGGGHDDDEDGPGDEAAITSYDFKKRKKEVFVDGVGGYTLSRDGEKLAWLKDGVVFVADAGGKPDMKDMDEKLVLKSLPLEVNPSDEWRQIFAEAWRLQRDFYWAENMVGVDWPAMKFKYEELIDRVATRAELNDLIGQLIGELGTSHTYVFGGDSAFNPPSPVPVGVLGADIELDKDAGLHKFVRVLRPEVWETDVVSPLTMSHANVREGEFLIAVNGRELKPTDNADSRFTNLAGVQVLLTVCSKPDKSDARDVQLETLRSDEQLRYLDWCRRNREYVNEKTSGKVGYIHIPDMGGAGLIRFIKGFYPQLTKDALIIDDRSNGGGFVSQMIIEKLNRRIWAYDKPRRGMASSYPEKVHPGYKCVLIDEHAGSDGDIFPDSFRTLGLGPLIGKRTWGGVVGIRMDKRFIDAGMSSQPEFAWWDTKRGWSLENVGVSPDIEVEFRPEDRLAGRDPQLDRGIEEMMKRIREKPVDRPQPPPLPVRAPKPQTAGSQ